MKASEKLSALEDWLRARKSVLVAYSGGVDSTFLAAVAGRAIGERSLAVTADSAIYPTAETEKAKEIAAQIGIRHRVVHTHELSRPEFVENGPLRCYHCKQELFAHLFVIAKEERIDCVVDGRHEDDRNDYRPGAKAARELGIASPLAELEFSKEEIRALSRELGLPTWNKPAHPCLSTRFAYGMKITEDRLDRVEDAEAFLRHLGVGELRIRQHGEIARVEVRAEDFHFFIDPRTGPRIVEALKTRGGYKYVTLDLEGFRSGSMNETLVQGGWTRERRAKQSS